MAHNFRNRRTARHLAGFTLVEVLLVIAIIGVLATVLIVTIGGAGEDANIKLTDTMIKKIAAKLELYNIHIGHHPTEGEGGLDALMIKPNFDEEALTEKWKGPYVQEQELKDAWGHKLNYEPADAGAEIAPGIKFKLWSNGPDNQSNTQDDITNLPKEAATR